MHEDWTDDSEWPRRLLHVETLTSYEWQPAGTYGGHVAPAYNAISYTWGRFQLEASERPEVEAMPLKGTSWAAHLPRIRPECFGPDDLRRTLKVATQPWEGYSRVEFVWLDVACIDQTPGSRDNEIEVGRQAKIFKGARNTFVWLWRLDTRLLLGWAEQMSRIFESTCFTEPPDLAAPDEEKVWLDAVSACFEAFTSDPWFGSLWTLQEAFLCPGAIFIPKDGIADELLRVGDRHVEVYSLHTLHAWIKIWQDILSQVVLPRNVQDNALQKAALFQKITDVGFIESTMNTMITTGSTRRPPPAEPYMGNPFRLLAASRHRNPKNERDRVYGIMQVFDLRLGKSAPGFQSSQSSPPEEFSLKDLELELSEALLHKYPLFSQLVTYDETCETGKRWMMNASVSLPELAFQAWDHQALGGTVHNTAKLSTAVVRGQTWAAFHGPIARYQCWFDSLSKSRDTGSPMGMEIVLDGLRGPAQTLVRTQGGVADAPEDLVVLALGSLRASHQLPLHRHMFPFEHQDVGLLLLPYFVSGGMQVYARVGLASWAANNAKIKGPWEAAAAESSTGHTSIWRDHKGLFG